MRGFNSAGRAIKSRGAARQSAGNAGAAAEKLKPSIAKPFGQLSCEPMGWRGLPKALQVAQGSPAIASHRQSMRRLLRLATRQRLEGLPRAHFHRSLFAPYVPAPASRDEAGSGV